MTKEEAEKTVEESPEELQARLKRLRIESGLQDGKRNRSPAAGHPDYLAGYTVGRNELREQRRKDGLCPTCGK